MNDIIVTVKDVLRPIFICYYCIVTDVIVTGSEDLRPTFYYFVIMVHDVIEQCGCQGVTRAWCCGTVT